MSLDLTLLPMREPQKLSETSVLCYDRLAFDQDYRIFGQLIDLSYRRQGEQDDIPASPTIKVTPIPPQMWVEIYEDGGVERTREDMYDNGLTFVYAEQLKKLKIPDNSSPKNKAIKTFIDALPDNTPIILQWR